LYGLGIAYDGVAAAVPILPGFAGASIKAKRAAKAIEQAAETAGDAADSAKTLQSYTKTNPTTGQVKCGRTSGCGTPLENIAKRDSNHHKNKDGFGPAVVDQSSSNTAAVRGREQQLIDAHGVAKSNGEASGNTINGIS